METLRDPDALWEALFDTAAGDWSRKDVPDEKTGEPGKNAKGK